MPAAPLLDNTQSHSQATSSRKPFTNRCGSFTYALGGFVAGSANTGQRVFNVLINGRAKLSNFDIVAAAGGENKATIQSIATTADSSGKIAIQFSPVKDNAQSTQLR